MINFSDTSIAFKHKSDKDLKRAHFLFRIMGSSFLVSVGKGLTNVGLALRLPINGIIKATIFKQFCGGETINEGVATSKELWKQKIGAILDYSVEGKTSSEDFEHATQEIIATISESKKNEAIPFAVFKVTGLIRFELLEAINNGTDSLSEVEMKEYEESIERVNRICKAAFDNQVPLFIDAEDSWIQDGIDKMVHDMMLKYNKEKAIVYNTIQMYRHDRLDFMKKHMVWAKEVGIHYGVKIVRGAYMEKERERAAQKGYKDPIQPEKASCDRDFNAVIAFLLDDENINQMAMCCGTHNEESSAYLAELMDKKNIAKTDSRIYFAQLLGMSDHISYTMADLGYNVAKYVPYGPIKEVIPYLFRRADENTSVKGQTGRELSLIKQELKRRKGND